MAPPVISLAITPKTPADQQKLARALQVLAVEGVEVHVSPGVPADCTMIGATSEADLEQIVDRLKREYGVEARVGKPTVTYLETLTQSAEGTAKHVRMAHDQAGYAHVSLRVHPGEAGSGYSFADTTIEGTIPARFMPSIESGIRDSMANGVLNRYPIVDVRVELYDGSYHDADSTEAAFRTAAAMAFQAAAKKAEPLVLEPVMQVVVRTGNRYVNMVLERLLTRRGEIHERTHEPEQEVITARVPLSNLFGFEALLRADTLGHASCSIRFAYYQPVEQGPAGDDDRTSRVGAPRRPTPNVRSGAASVREPDDGEAGA